MPQWPPRPHVVAPVAAIALLLAACGAEARLAAGMRNKRNSSTAVFDMREQDDRMTKPPFGAMPCSDPVRRAPVVFPEELILGGLGDANDSPMYSGYVNVTETDFLFYWFMEAKPGARSDAPLIVWSNGGPGCSAMEGATTEHGPFVLYGIKEEGNLFSGKLSRNPFAWNLEAHVLYVDQPRYVGFSCGTGPYVMSSRDAGKDMVRFLRGWRELFPEHKHRGLILAAESYGGHYVPAWSTAILDDAASTVSEDRLELIGIAIGNGIVNDTIQAQSFPEFARRQGLMPKNGTPPRSAWNARKSMHDFLGYVPNYYDYRLVEEECCGCSSYNYKPWSNWMLRKDVLQALNVCGDAGDKAFAACSAGCIDMPPFDLDDDFDYSAAVGRALHAGVLVTFYYGMQDTACNYMGGYAMVNALEWPGAAAFAQTPAQELKLGGVTAGMMRSAAGLTWIQVEGAGHMVPINNPAAASFAIGTIIHGRGPKPDIRVDDFATRQHRHHMDNITTYPGKVSQLDERSSKKFQERIMGRALEQPLHRGIGEKLAEPHQQGRAASEDATRLSQRVQEWAVAFACGCLSMVVISIGSGRLGQRQICIDAVEASAVGVGASISHVVVDSSFPLDSSFPRGSYMRAASSSDWTDLAEDSASRPLSVAE